MLITHSVVKELKQIYQVTRAENTKYPSLRRRHCSNIARKLDRSATEITRVSGVTSLRRLARLFICARVQTRASVNYFSTSYAI